jgi:nucleoid-associated protein Lsr2
MAQKVTIELVDDLDGSTAAETVTFALDGAAYEIDLNKSNAAKLRKALSPFASSARAIRGRQGVVKGKRTGPDPAKVRSWATSQGIEVSPRGRVPQALVEQYLASS